MTDWTTAFRVQQLIRKAKAFAAKKRYERAKDAAMASMAEAASSGRRPVPWTREEIHDR